MDVEALAVTILCDIRHHPGHFDSCIVEGNSEATKVFNGHCNELLDLLFLDYIRHYPCDIYLRVNC